MPTADAAGQRRRPRSRRRLRTRIIVTITLLGFCLTALFAYSTTLLRTRVENQLLSDALNRNIDAYASAFERDPTNAGELPVIRGTLYAEVYKDPLTYPDYGNDRMVEYIFQYETAVGADQYGREIRYRILNKLQGVYTPDGKPAAYTGVHDEPADEADDIYAAMYRLSKNY